MLNRQSILVLAPLLAFGCSDFATAPDRTPASLRVTPDTALLTAGDSIGLELELVDEDGVAYDHVPSWAPLWTVDDPDVLEVHGSGRATALRAGQSQGIVSVAGLRDTVLVRANPVDLQLDVPVVYVTQSVQRPEGDVPLIAGRDGLLRVFVVGDDVNWFRPRVQATFYRAGEAVHAAVMELGGPGLPEAVDEGTLSLSYDADVPGSVLRPGVGIVVEVDPEGIVPARDGSTLRVPASGVLDLAVQEVPPFRWTLVPVDQSFNGLESRFKLDVVFAEPMTRLSKDLFPFAAFDFEVRDSYTTDADLRRQAGWLDLIDEIVLLRWDDGSPRYYYGGFQVPSGSPFGGLGYVGFPVSIGVDDRDGTIAHELGHNLGLFHAPCPTSGNRAPDGVDPDYPYPNASIGQHGWDTRRRRLHRPDEKKDLMSYCDPIWVSDYNYEKVVAYRDSSAFDAAFAGGAPATDATTVKQPVVVIQGGVANGELRLGPALEWNGSVVLPRAGGSYRVEGLDAGGGVLFSVAVEPRPLGHADGSQFMVAVPAEMAQPDRLARIRLMGPEGSIERRASGAPRRTAEVVLEAAGGRPGAAPEIRFDAEAYPLAVVRDADTGRIRAMSRSGRLAVPADMDRFEVVVSDGVRTRPARVVRR